LVVTDLAVIEPTADGLLLRERAPGVTVDQVLAATAAPLIVPRTVPEIALASVAPQIDPERAVIEPGNQERRATGAAGGG
jgi:acetate CoA/acetoacetate CoA-transferase beta subunit